MMQNNATLKLIEESLCESHTSMTALCTWVCMFACLRPYTINFLISTFKYVTNTERSHQPAVSKGLLPERSVGMKETRSEDNSS